VLCNDIESKGSIKEYSNISVSISYFQGGVIEIRN
jgi:hypothetical protein